MRNPNKMRPVITDGITVDRGHVEGGIAWTVDRGHVEGGIALTVDRGHVEGGIALFIYYYWHCVGGGGWGLWLCVGMCVCVWWRVHRHAQESMWVGD